VLRATLLPVYDGVDEVYYAHTLQLPRISKRSFAGTTSVPRKSDTGRAVCKSNPEHGVYSPVQYSAPSVHRLYPFPPSLLPLLAPYTRARAYAYLFNVQKAECTREKYSHYIALVRVLLRDRGFTVYRRSMSERKGYDMCKHACSRVVMAGAGPVDSTELYRQSPADIKGTMWTDCPKVIYMYWLANKMIGQPSNIGNTRYSILCHISAVCLTTKQKTEINKLALTHRL